MAGSDEDVEPVDSDVDMDSSEEFPFSDEDDDVEEDENDEDFHMEDVVDADDDDEEKVAQVAKSEPKARVRHVPHEKTRQLPQPRRVATPIIEEKPAKPVEPVVPQETEEEKAEKAKREQAQRDASWKKYLIGELGRTRIVEGLSSSESPFKAIQDFKVENGLRTPLADAKSFFPILELLDLHGIKRTDLYKQLLDGMLELVLRRCAVPEESTDEAGVDTPSVAGSVSALPRGPGKQMAPSGGLKDHGAGPVLPELTNKDRDRLLRETFPYIGFEELQQVPFTLLKQTEAMPKAFLRQLGANAKLYETSPIQVKRQIWEMEEPLFVREVQPLLDSYVTSSVSSPPEFGDSAPSPKRRRESNLVVRQLVTAMGTSVQLYTYLVKFCSHLYIATGHTHYCSLRTDLLMALHDHGTSVIYEKDPCHKFAWYLDACVADSSMENQDRRISEVASLLSEVPSGSALLGELAMILADSYSMNVLVKSIFVRLRDAIKRNQLPRNDSLLKQVTPLAALGTHAFNILSKQQYRMPKTEKDLLQGAFVHIGHMLMDDELRAFGTEVPYAKPTEKFRKLFSTNLLARRVAWQYVLAKLEAGQIEATKEVLALTVELGPAVNTEATFLHTLVTLPAVGRNAEAREAVIDNCLFALQGELMVHMELLHFLATHHVALPIRIFNSYLSTICSFRTTESAASNLILKVVAHLQARVGNRINDATAPFFTQYLDCLRDPTTVRKADLRASTSAVPKIDPVAQAADSTAATSENETVDVMAD